MKNEAKIKFSAETEEFDSAIKKSNKEISVLRGELKLNEAEMKNNGTSAEGLKKKIDLLTKQSEQQRNKTKALASELESAKRIYGEDSQEVAKLTNKLNASKASEQRLEAQIEQTNSEMKEQKVDSEKLAKAHETLKNGMDKFANASGVVAGATVAAGAGAISAFNEVDEGADAAIIATGATGEAANELKETYKNVASSVKGEFSTIGSALGEVETRFEFTGKKAEDCTVSFMKFAEINGVDATESVRLVSRAMEDAGIESDKYGTILDQLTVAAQASGVGVSNLAENLAKYGAPMRNLGFDTKESIALFAQWEKTGVNTSIAFSGMKKAISNWSSEGKDARVEFKKTLDEIQNTPDIASATTKAIEVFGAKAGPDLADAIKGGRFEYSKFLETLDDSEGSLNSTYETIQDGQDRATIAMQNLKIAGSEVGEALLTQLEPVINGLVDKSKDFVEYAEKNGDKIVTTIETVGAVAGTVFAINKIAKFTNSVKTLGSAVGTTYKAIIAKKVESTKATVAETTAQSGLLAVMQAHPVILFGTAIAGLAAGIGYLAMKSKELPEEAKKTREEYTEFNKAIIENGNAVNQQFGVYDRQIENLESIVDKNGKIKKGYEDQAETITGQLSEALGIEISIVDGQIKGYKELKKKIYETIAAKKAEAVLDANKDNYTKAIENQTKYAQKISETSDLIESKKTEVEEAEKSVNAIEKQLAEEQSKRVTDRSQTRINQLNNELLQARAVRDVRKDSLDDLKYNLKEEQNAYGTATRTIENYEKLQVAAKTGSVNELNNATTVMINNLKTSTTATKEELKKQEEAAKESLNKMKEAYERGDVPKSAVKSARKVWKATKNELDKADYSSSAKKGMKTYNDAIKETDTSQAVKSLTSKIIAQMKRSLSNVHYDLNLKIKSKNKNLNNLGKIVFGANIQANAKGNIVKSPIITAFAEDGPEAAIPINDKPRSKALWLETGRLMGMINTDIGNNSASKSMQIEQTNRLLTAILNKDNNMYVSGYKVSQATATSRDRVDGINNTLAERRIAIG